MTGPITTHVLDTSLGQPAAGITTRQEQKSHNGWDDIGTSVTNSDGRIADLISADKIDAGIYRISFETGEYFSRTGRIGFYPVERIEFEVRDPEQHYHVPLLLIPFGYSTYRGS